MRPLFLDFERKVHGTKLGYGLLVVGVLVTTVVIGAQALVSEEIERHATAAPAAETKRDPWVLPAGISSEADAIAGARAVVGHLAGAGDRLFVTLEAIDEPDVALLALRPDTRKRTLRIDAEAKTADAMLAYLRVLEQSRAFTQVVLVEHEIQDTDPLRPMRFSLTAAWGP